MALEQKRFYKDFLSAKEGIATNILSDRLKKLEENEIISSSVYQHKKTQKEYVLTEKGKDLIPILLEMMVWSYQHKKGLNIEKSFIDKIKKNRAEVLDYFISRL